MAVSAKRVLAVGAHPDDLEILCGGALAKFASLGWHVTMAVVTNGDMGHIKIPSDELADIRKEEFCASAAVIGAEPVWVGVRDERVYEDEPTRNKVIDVVRRARPDLILTHSPADYHPDHVAVSQLVFDASFVSTLPQYETAAPHHPVVAPLYYMDTLAGVDFLPEEYVDISDFLDAKLEMLRCHRSQLQWLDDHDGVDIVRMVEITARFRGIQCGVKAAEGFAQKRAWPRQKAVRLLP